MGCIGNMACHKARSQWRRLVYVDRRRDYDRYYWEPCDGSLTSLHHSRLPPAFAAQFSHFGTRLDVVDRFGLYLVFQCLEIGLSDSVTLLSHPMFLHQFSKISGRVRLSCFSHYDSIPGFLTFGVVPAASPVSHWARTPSSPHVVYSLVSAHGAAPVRTVVVLRGGSVSEPCYNAMGVELVATLW